jgi:trehalose utilization protein
MGTNRNLAWRELPEGDLERVWVIHPAHPIAEGLPAYFEVQQSEMYGEPFDIPVPAELIFVSWFKGGEVFRSGCTFQRGRGRVFFFGPGHETFPIYHNAHVHRVIANAIRWAKQPHHRWAYFEQLASRDTDSSLGWSLAPSGCSWFWEIEIFKIRAKKPSSSSNFW